MFCLEVLPFGIRIMRRANICGVGQQYVAFACSSVWIIIEFKIYLFRLRVLKSTVSLYKGAYSFSWWYVRHPSGPGPSEPPLSSSSSSCSVFFFSQVQVFQLLLLLVTFLVSPVVVAAELLTQKEFWSRWNQTRTGNFLQIKPWSRRTPAGIKSQN